MTFMTKLQLDLFNLKNYSCSIFIKIIKSIVLYRSSVARNLENLADGLNFFRPAHKFLCQNTSNWSLAYWFSLLPCVWLDKHEMFSLYLGSPIILGYF